MDKQGACVKLTSSIIIMIIGLSLTLCSKKPVFDKQHPPNILLIVLDAARADHFSSYGYHRPTTPNMDRMAGEGVRFTRAVSTSSWTLPSHASLFTGLLPDEHGTRNQHAWLIDRFPTLAELLQKQAVLQIIRLSTSITTLSGALKFSRESGPTVRLLAKPSLTTASTQTF